MPHIETAEDAIRRADEFLSKYYLIRQPVSVKRDEELWRLVFEVGLFDMPTVHLSIDAATGAVTEYAKQGAA